MLRLVWLAVAVGLGTAYGMTAEMHSLMNSSLWSRVSELYPVAPVRAIPYRFNIHKEDTFHETNVIPADHQVSSYLYHRQTKRFLFLLHKTAPNMVLIITPCNSIIKWTLRYRHENDTGKVSDTTSEHPAVREYNGREPQTLTISPARQGLYLLNVTAVEKETYVNLYATLQPRETIQLKFDQRPKIRLQKRQLRKVGHTKKSKVDLKRKLTVRWEPSPLDPFLMHYCVAINTHHHYHSLCEAQSDSRQGVFSREKSNYNSRQQQSDVILGCVKKRTSFTVDNMEPGKMYYFNVFAINRNSNLTIPHGNATLLYDGRTRASGLRDNRPVTVSLRHLDGKAVFRYKVSKKPKHGSKLEWHVLPCGGSVMAEVKHQKEVLVSRQRVDGYARITIDDPVLGQRYSLHVLSKDPEELRRISGIEVLATMQGTSLPMLPKHSKVMEYIGLRRCNSVTVGWLPVPEPHEAHYCIRATELPAHMTPSHSKILLRPNQCGLDARLRSSTDFAVTQCLDQLHSPNDPLSILTQQVNNLKPGHKYLIQVTVKKAKGKSLSYDLLQVHTKSHCS